MPDTEKQDTGVQTGTETQEATKAESPIEALARTLGHKPKDEFDGDPEKWVDADAFVAIRFEKVSERFNESNRKMRELETTLKGVSAHMSKVEKLAYDRAIADLKAQRNTAITDGDVDAVAALDTQIDEVKEALVKEAPAKDEKTENQLDPAIQEWIGKNKWFERDKKLGSYAATQYDWYVANYPDWTIAEALAYAEKETKAKFPDKFENPKRHETPAVETGGNGTGGGKRKFTRTDLNDSQKKMHDYFIKTGDLTSEQYIQQLIDLGELGGKK